MNIKYAGYPSNRNEAPTCDLRRSAGVGRNSSRDKVTRGVIIKRHVIGRTTNSLSTWSSAQVDDTPRCRERKGKKERRENYIVAIGRWITALASSGDRGCTCATPTQRNRGRVIAGGGRKNLTHDVSIRTRVLIWQRGKRRHIMIPEF